MVSRGLTLLVIKPRGTLFKKTVSNNTMQKNNKIKKIKVV